jgi:hypothetical protein
MTLHLDTFWIGQLRRMRRHDPVYKPALLLVVLDLIDEGLGVPDCVPLKLAVERFDEVLSAAGLLAKRGPGRAVMPAYHLSMASSTNHPFWDLVMGGVALGAISEPGTNPALLKLADGVRFHAELRAALATPEGRAAVRSAIYMLLEADARPDCLALLASHDKDKPAVDAGVLLLTQGERGAFSLDDPNAMTVRTLSEHVVRDRALRLAVLSAYNQSCALCCSRIVWNNLVEVEAAHIKPRSLRGADDPRNALALCRTHHWAFDLGLWTIEDNLQVTFRDPSAPGDDFAALHALKPRTLQSLVRASARPHPDALRWHREYIFGRAA